MAKLAHRLQRIAAATFKELAEIATLATERGWAEAGAGNFSIRLSADISTATARSLPLPLPYPELAGCSLLLKQTGARMRDIRRRPVPGICLVRVSTTGTELTIWPPTARPTSEYLAHLAGQRTLIGCRPEDRVLLHLHPTATVALSLLIPYRRLPALLSRMHSEGPTLLRNRITALRFAPPGSAQLAELTGAALRRYAGVIWPGHGIIASGPTLSAALDLVELTDKAAMIALYQGLVRASVRGLDSLKRIMVFSTTQR